MFGKLNVNEFVGMALEFTFVHVGTGRREGPQTSFRSCVPLAEAKRVIRVRKAEMCPPNGFSYAREHGLLWYRLPYASFDVPAAS